MSSEEFKNQRINGGWEIGGDDDVVSISSLLKLGVAPASVFICASWRQGWLGGMATVVAKWVPGPIHSVDPETLGSRVWIRFHISGTPE